LAEAYDVAIRTKTKGKTNSCEIMENFPALAIAERIEESKEEN